MFIKVINSSAEHKGKSLLIKKDLIKTVFEAKAPTEDEPDRTTTVIFASAELIWQVEQTVDQVYHLLGGVDNS